MTISCIILTKNNEDKIQQLLSNVVNKFDEIIVLDTGSSDATIQIVNTFGSEKVQRHYLKWSDDFSEARNFALKKASCDWAFFIDSDEMLIDTFCIDYFKEFLKVVNHTFKKEKVVLCPTILDTRNNKKIYGVERIFRLSDSLEYKGVVHEYLCTGEVDSVIKKFDLITLLSHDGYIHNKSEKHKRNIHLLERQLKIEPDNMRWVYFFAKESHNILSLKERENFILDNVLLNNKQAISSSNLKHSIYTERILFILCEIYLISESQKFFIILDLLKKINANSNDIFYYESLKKYLSLQADMLKLTQKIFEFRKNKEFFGFDSINSTGEHIDTLLVSCLFDTKHFKSAYNLLGSLSHKIKDNDVITELLLDYKKIYIIYKNNNNL